MPSPPFSAGVKGRSATRVGSGRRTCSSGRSRGFSAVLVSALVTRGTLSYRIPPTLAQVETQTLSATDRLEEKPMRMAVFSSKPYDREFLEAANARAGAPHQLSFLEARLSLETASLA